jgi:hypothetical protein
LTHEVDNKELFLGYKDLCACNTFVLDANHFAKVGVQ